MILPPPQKKNPFASFAPTQAHTIKPLLIRTLTSVRRGEYQPTDGTYKINGE